MGDRPTVEELENLLSNPSVGPVELLPDGSVRVGEGEVERLQAALEKYGQHKEDCLPSLIAEARCICGLHDAKLAVGGEKREYAEVDIVFDGPPGPVCGRFVEVERDGKGISVGKWVHREDGYWVLRLDAALAGGPKGRQRG